ncbi:trehalose-phosphatase [Sphingopyxis sp. MWB1]|uniref:trehalose-phosphatase n=1 Tax=Sphingopyxis sp. MWB1 TaxID=1537715 RepID=UPI00051A13B2|nr:trehalose-phosphatase [Sphingopyxis sp. MWB1]
MHNRTHLAPPPALDALAAQHPLALFLDFDGTLVEIADTPDGISVDHQLSARLMALCAALEGRVAIVSGRAVADISLYLDVPGLMIVGSHGAEIGGADRPDLVLSAASRAELDALLGAHAALLLEAKPHGIALHYRQEPDAAPSVFKVMEAIARREGLAQRRGKMVVELGPRGANKGAALASLMTSAPFHGALPIFIGDDITDEDGFAAASADAGYGILVGHDRPTAARYRLNNPTEVHQWLTL